MVIKTFSIVMLFTFLSCIGLRQVKTPYNYIKDLILQGQFISDTALIGDSICVELCYTNISEEAIKFLPSSILILSHSDPLGNYDYGEISCLYLNREIDEETITLIPSHSIYCIKYSIEINDNLFNVGKNEMLIQYIYKPLNTEKTENDNEILKGSLFSNKVVLYIN